MDEKVVNNSNIPNLSVGKLVDELALAYQNIINAGLPVKVFPSVMLWGPPGVGKSQAVRQLAMRIESATKKKVNVTDVRLLLFNPIDLRGIPTANADKTLAIWLKPQIFQMDASEDVVNILFLDELSSAPQSVQAAAYQITLDRVVGEHKLPENCIVIAAGNRTTDRSVAFNMPKALANRLMHIEVSANFESWKQWAIRSGINDKVVGFLSFSRHSLMKFNAENSFLAFATPRSWEAVSNILNCVSNDVDKVYDLIAGVIGSGMAVEFRNWSKIYDDLPSIEDIFDGKMPKFTTSTDATYALCSSMTAYAREHSDDMRRIANSVQYACHLSPDFSAMLFRDYYAIREDFRIKLLGIPEFSAWLSKKGRIINGIK